MWGVIQNAIPTTNPSTPGVTKPHPKYQNNNINKQNIKILFKQQQGLPYKMSQIVHHKNILVFPKQLKIYVNWRYRGSATAIFV